MINISINLGPGVIWLSMIFVTFWIALAAFFAGRAAEQMTNAREVQRRTRQMLTAPWQAPGAPLVVTRVDRRLALIGVRKMLEEEEQEAA